MINFKKILLLLSVVFIISACDDNDTWCEGSASDAYSDSDGIKKVNNTSIKVNSVSAENPDGNFNNYGKWVDSGFYVEEYDDFQISATGQIVIATDYEDDSNLGDGKEYIIPATKGTVTPVLDDDGEYFDFALNQQITVIVNDCGTNSSDYCTPTDCATSTFEYCIVDDGCKPNKWTWDAGWKRDEINCNFVDIIDFYFGNDAREECNAYRCCSEDIFGTCWNYEKWDCAHQTTIQENAYSSTYTDGDGNVTKYNVCPTTDEGIYSYPYICDGNNAEEAEYYANPTNPPYLPEGSNEYCDGGGDDKSGSSPRCGDRSNSHDYAKEPYSYNLKGESDTCWNTGGYRLYAMEGGVVCPVGCNYPPWNDPTADVANPCPDGCTHLLGGYRTFDETKGGEANFTAGTSFASRGDTLNLQIINPLGENTEDVSGYQGQIEQNDQDISYYESLISSDDNDDDLYDQLTIQLDVVENYNPDGVDDGSIIDNLRSSAITLSAGLIDDTAGNNLNASVKAQLDEIVTLFDQEAEEEETTEEEEETTEEEEEDYCLAPTDTEGLQQMFNVLGANIIDYSGDKYSQCWITTIDFMSEGEDETDPDGVIIEDIHKVKDIRDAGDDLSTTITEADDPATATTSQDIQNFKDDLENTLSDLEYDMTILMDIQDEIDDYNQLIADLESDNDDLSEAILEDTTYGNAGLVGGYTVYVSAGALVADDGEYLHAIVSDGDPNGGDATTVTTEFSPELNVPAGQSIAYMDTVYTAQSSGNVWTFIDDPDGRWDNNSGYYDVAFGKITYSEGFDALITGLIEDIKDTVTTTAERIFKGITCSDGGSSWQCSEYLKIITAMLYLYIIIWGMMYLFGLIRTDRLDFVIRIAKIATVTVLIQPGSWDFFNTYLFQGFSTISDTIIANATGAPLDNPFRFLNQNMNVMLLDETTYYKLMGMMVQGLMGLVIFSLLIYGTISFIVSFFQAFLVYMISFIGLGICMALAPIFLVFLLYDKTKYLFTAWFNLMVRFSVQPVLLLIGLVIINGMLATIIDSIFNYYVCYKCALPITFAIPGYPQVGTTTLFCVSWFSPWGDDNVGSPGTSAIMSIPLAIIFCMVTSVMEIYTGKLSGDVCKAITGSVGIPTKGGSSSMGLNPLKGLDNRMKSIATFTGAAKDEKEYKALRNKALSGAAKMSMVMSNPVGAASYLASKMQTKKIDPKSLNEENTTPKK